MPYFDSSGWFLIEKTTILTNSCCLHVQPTFGYFSVIGQAVVELPRVWCLRHPLTQHVPRAVSGAGVYRCRSNTKLIEWWHRTKKTARALVIPFQRYKRLKIVTVPVILTFLWYMHIHGCYRCRSKHSSRSPIQTLTGPDAAWLFFKEGNQRRHPASNSRTQYLSAFFFILRFVKKNRISLE